ncbi:hypothetical protein IW261DRAFT_1439727 [Armillaria novae-zelandiae]|uniref:Uncharacterized protein n=1 Tax=Armillaria novae-zelandiae TaxID=153914 RepID=A0AA39TH50_9AGAR|nr:hypothetical protein IW261DRAFT_1439727 [Armillaria novae-zelandiae]
MVPVVVLDPPYNHKMVETQLQRSGNFPLSVYIYVGSYGEHVHRSSTIIDHVIGLCHRWSKLELHGNGPIRSQHQSPSLFLQLRTLKMQGTWSRHIISVLDAPLLKTIWLDNFAMQPVPHHATHLALSRLSIKEVPVLSSSLNLVELHDFTPNGFPEDAAPTSTITHPPFVFSPYLASSYRTQDNSAVSAFLSRSRCTLKPS